MKICEVAIDTTDLDAAADFYRNVLRLPVTAEPERVTVQVGLSKLVLTRGAPFAGVHHLAFGISPDDFELAQNWVRGQVDTSKADQRRRRAYTVRRLVPTFLAVA
ncbi:VOC family protein [Nocardia suismassiliense]|uniref:VOC family protein n=1 Tax=Nocardia suismassiliense TaxID=2077092 RepID=A0ABW6R3U6_9NOCA